MKLAKSVMTELRVRPGGPAGLGDRSTSTTETTWIGSEEKTYKKMAEEDLRQFVDELSDAQRPFWANDTHGLLIILQARDAAGKDGTIRHVMSGVNPQGCAVEAFRQPSAEELGHDFLWRSATKLPPRGMIAIFNRSYYEEVLVARVHPELLARGKGGSRGQPSEQLWSDRFEDINAFEHHLDRTGTRIVEIFLHVSRNQQKKRSLSAWMLPTRTGSSQPRIWSNASTGTRIKAPTKML